MIIEQSRILQERLNVLNQAERRKKEIKQIDDTRVELQQISKRIQLLVKQYKTVEHLLSDENRQEILDCFRHLNEKIGYFFDDFQTNSDQSRRLKPFGDNSVTQCADTLYEMWEAFVINEVSNEADIFLLVKDLPDVRANGTKIEGALQRLAKFQQSPPRKEAQLTDYHADVATLKSQIEGIQGLTEAVKMFLEKIASNSATIEDLTPEIFDWCREPSRANHFIIKISEGMH